MITNGDVLKLDNLLSKRVEITQNDLSLLLNRIRSFCYNNEIVVNNIVTATFGVRNDNNNNQLIDMEILLDLQGNTIPNNFPDDFQTKEKIEIINALHTHFMGKNQESIIAYNEINQYISEHSLQPITPAYAVSHNPYNNSDDIIDIDIYVGINPNIM